MARARYTITTWGNTTTVHLENPGNYPLAEFVGFRQDEGATRAALPEKPKKSKRRGKKKRR